MARSKRHWLPKACYHLTHRCLDKQYFFQYSITRDIYVLELREMISRYKVNILNYCVTGNHVHLLVQAEHGTEIEKGMQYLQGRMGQRYNSFKNRHGAFWCGRYHATLIENGGHLSECLFYIDYNMMRAGAVGHPSEWKHCGYHEITGNKKRNTIVNIQKLLLCLGMSEEKESFLKWYSNTIEAKATRFLEREPKWSEALAVGSSDWIDQIKGKLGKKRLHITDTRKDQKKEFRYSIPESSTYFLNEKPSQYAIY